MDLQVILEPMFFWIIIIINVTNVTRFISKTNTLK